MKLRLADVIKSVFLFHDLSLFYNPQLEGENIFPYHLLTYIRLRKASLVLAIFSSPCSKAALEKP